MSMQSMEMTLATGWTRLGHGRLWTKLMDSLFNLAILSCFGKGEPGTVRFISVVLELLHK
jgi:hypothetical protein